RMLHRGKREQVVLNEHGMRVAAMHSPFAMVMREISDKNNMMYLLAGVPELAIQHDACSWPRRRLPRNIAPGNVETLDHHMVRCSQQDHPVRHTRCLIDHNITRLSHGFEKNIAAIPS